MDQHTAYTLPEAVQAGVPVAVEDIGHVDWLHPEERAYIWVRCKVDITSIEAAIPLNRYALVRAGIASSAEKEDGFDGPLRHKPVVVVCDASGMMLKDGWHPLVLAKEAGVAEVEAYVGISPTPMCRARIRAEESRAEWEQHDANWEFHEEALEETGYWGREAAGCILIAKSTGRVLIGLRGEEVLQPGTWGTFGGAIDHGESPTDTVLREAKEELGFREAGELLHLWTYEAPDSDFRYHNYAIVVDEEFVPDLFDVEETAAAAWFDFGDWPEPMHFGLKALLEQDEAVARIQDLCRSPGPRPR